MTRTPLSRSKGQRSTCRGGAILCRSRSPGRFAHRRVGASGGCSGGRGNVLAVGNCCYVAICSAVQGASAPTGEERSGAYRGGRPPTACFICNSPVQVGTTINILNYNNLTNIRIPYILQLFRDFSRKCSRRRIVGITSTRVLLESCDQSADILFQNTILPYLSTYTYLTR